MFGEKARPHGMKTASRLIAGFRLTELRWTAVAGGMTRQKGEDEARAARPPENGGRKKRARLYWGRIFNERTKG
jgi:hypothetical protein